MEALLSASARADEGAPPRARSLAHAVSSRLLTLSVGLCAAIPVIAAVARALHDGWQPVADRGIIATRAFDVFSSHTPLVGQYSFASTVTGKLTYSLGPLLYWLLAPAARIGAPQSFVWTMAVVNVGSILGAVALARRRGGVWLMLAAAIGIALMCRSLASNNFYDIWNPSAGLFPLLLLIFVGWSLACGDYRLLPLAVLLASFEMQCEDGFVAPAVAAFGVGVVGLALWWLARRRERDRSAPLADSAPGDDADPRANPAPRAKRDVVWPWLLAAFVVLLVCWTPPLVDQIAHEGNIGHVLQAVGKRKSPLGASVGVHAVVRTVGVTPWWLTRPSDPFIRKTDVRRSASTLANLSTALILGWLLIACALAIRRRRVAVASASALALVLCAAIFSMANATPSTPRFIAETLGYTLWSATTVGMFVWLIALWSAVVLSGLGEAVSRAASSRRRSARSPERLRASATALGAVLALALAAGAGAIGAEAGTADEHAFEFAALKTINSRLGAVPRGHSVYLNAKLDGLITPLRPEITYDLRRRGVRPLGVGAYLRTGHWYELAEHPFDYVVWVYDDGRVPVAGAHVIAAAHISSDGRRHTVEVAISPKRFGTEGNWQTGASGTQAPGRSGTRASRAIAIRTDVAVANAADVSAGAAGGAWSAPRRLAGCPIAGPRVVFPSEGPSDRTGPGAIVWISRGRCGASSRPRDLVASAGSPWLSQASISSDERATAVGGRPWDGIYQPTELTAVGASYGGVAVAVNAQPRSDEAASGEGGYSGLFQGGPGTPLALEPVAAGGSPAALTRAYLGDAAFATLVGANTPRKQAIAVRVRHFDERSFASAKLIPLPPGRVTALTATMDYRADVLLAWQQNGAIYAHMLRVSGRRDPTQRLGASAPNPQLRALVSDNNHGMVAWSSTTAATGSPAKTHTYVDLSQVGVHFLSPRLLASFTDAARVGETAGSLGLVRLSTENVILAWTDRERGHYVVRAAPAVFAGARASALVSDASGQAVLGDLAAGPAAEAVVLWRAAPRGRPLSAGDSELWSARAVLLPGDRPIVGARARVAAAGPNVAASVAVDPANDRAVASWLTAGATPQVEYAASGGAPGYRPRAAPALPASIARSGGAHWLRIALAVLGAVIVAVLTLFGLRRRSRQVV